MAISTILLLFAFLCFALSALDVKPRINLQSTGLALWVLALLIG